LINPQEIPKEKIDRVMRIKVRNENTTLHRMISGYEEEKIDINGDRN
jgi:hypothetical protein